MATIKLNNKTTKRFIISKSLIGTNTIITFKNKKGDDCTYNHDKVYTTLKTDSKKWHAFRNIKAIPILIIYQNSLEI